MVVEAVADEGRCLASADGPNIRRFSTMLISFFTRMLRSTYSTYPVYVRFINSLLSRSLSISVPNELRVAVHNHCPCEVMRWERIVLLPQVCQKFCWS